MPLIWCSMGFSSFFKEGRLKLQYTRGVSFWALDIAMKSHFNTKLIELWRISVRGIFPIIFMILSGNRSLQLFLWVRDGGVWILPLFSGSHHSVDHGIVYKIFCWKSNYSVLPVFSWIINVICNPSIKPALFLDLVPLCYSVSMVNCVSGFSRALPISFLLAITNVSSTYMYLPFPPRSRPWLLLWFDSLPLWSLRYPGIF